MTKKFFIIAGEPSGDVLGAKLIRQIKEQLHFSNQPLEFIGVGGPQMIDEGLVSIFSMSELSVMGFVEVVPHINKLLKLINMTVTEIMAKRPDFIITIDAPDFNFRVMQKLKNEHFAKKIHMVAPSVWAYRPGRAKKIAPLYDLLLALLPFEPPYFTRHNLNCVFIGHPIIEEAPNLEQKSEIKTQFREKYGFYPDDTLLYITPGSRVAEVRKIFPEFIEAVNILKSKISNLSVVIGVVEKTKTIVENMAIEMEVKYTIIDNVEKKQALMASDFALAKSGTNTLEASLYELPMVIAYKVNSLTYTLAKMMIKIRFANLINLILEKEIIPEMIQQKCEGSLIAKRLEKLIKNKEEAQRQILESNLALKMLGYKGQESPTQKAVKEILQLK